MEDRFYLDNVNNVIDLEDERDVYCLTSEEVVELLNKLYYENNVLKKALNLSCERLELGQDEREKSINMQIMMKR